MRNFVDTQARMARWMDREPTPEEVIDAMADEYAARIDNARDRADECDPPEEVVTKYEDRRGS